MGEWTARGVLGSDDYGDMYKNVSANKQAQMNNLLQARQIAASGRNAAYGAAAQIAPYDSTRAGQIITNAEALYNADREESRQFVAPGTQFRRADGTYGYASTSSPENNAINQEQAMNIQQQRALELSGVNANDKSAIDPNHPQFQLRKAMNAYTYETDPVKRQFAMTNLQSYADPNLLKDERIFNSDPVNSEPNWLQKIWGGITGKTP